MPSYLYPPRRGRGENVMNVPPPQRIDTTDIPLLPAAQARPAHPASPSPTGVVAPRRHGGLNRERQPIVAARTFPILNESLAPPLSCTAATDDPRNHENIFTAGVPPMGTQELARLKGKTKEAVKWSVHKHVRLGEAADGDEAQNGGDVGDDGGDDGGGALRMDSRKAQPTSFLAHPRTAIQEAPASTAAAQISDLNTPHVRNSAHSAFVEPHERKESAVHHGNAQGAALADQSIDELKVRIWNMRMGVIMDRHIKRVRVLPQRRRQFPDKSEFLIRDENGEVVRDELGVEQVDYLTWLGQYLLYATQDVTSQYIEDWNQPPPLAVDRLRCHIERILTASQPWQHWLLHVRDVYRWKDPYETARWAILYCILWKYSQIASFALGYIIVGTLKNYLVPTTVSSLRTAVAKAQSRTVAARMLDRLLAHPGPAGALSALEPDLGPSAQLQLSDVADMLEVFENFAEWHAPRATLLALVFLSSVFLVAAVCDRELCVRLVSLLAGALFFGAWPIASRYPQYRHLVSPMKWAFWGVPTHVEWAFAELQTNRERLISRKLDGEEEGHGGKENSDFNEASARPAGAENIAAYSCYHANQLGSLVVSPDGVRFEGGGRHTEHRVLWDKRWKDLVEIAKIGEGSTGKRVGGAQGLKMVFLPAPAAPAAGSGAGGMGMGEGAEEPVVLARMGRRRDEAFGTIVGLSGLKWQWCG